MRTLGITVVLALVAAVVVMAGQPAKTPTAKTAVVAVAPQTPAAPQQAQVIKTFASAADVQALLAKAKADRKPGQITVAERILSLGPYVANMEYRPEHGTAAVHEKEAELMYVIEGSGSITTGGTVVDEKRTNSTNLTGTRIDGGNVQPIAKGDFIFVPENTPHQFSSVNGALVLMTFHVPRPVEWDRGR